MKSTRFVAALAAGLFAAGCTSSRTPSRGAERSPVAVALGRAETVDTTSYYEAGGVVRARSTAVIASRLMAPVAAVHVRAGDRVRRGAALVTLDSREMEANQARASAALASAVEATRAAESDTRAAESNLALARATYERVKTLHDKRSATPQELDQAVATLHAAEAQLESAKARAEAASAAREAARAAGASAEIGVSYTMLTAPFDGVVIDRAVDPGSMAVPGLALLTLEDPAAYRLEVQVDEARAGLINVGSPVEVHLDAASAEAWTPGAVSEVERIDPATHGFTVKIDLPRSQGVRSGRFGRARFAGPARRALTVPASSLVRRGQLTFVFAVDAEGVAALRPVTVGETARDRIEVLAGVREGDMVVIDPPTSLPEGARVRAAGGPGAADKPGSGGRP